MAGQVLDLGHGHTLRFLPWSPDRSIPSNAERFRGIPDDPRACAVIDHPDHYRPNERCRSQIMLNPRIHPYSWTVESWDPLTISPSVLCQACGDHGFIRGGKWVPA